MRILTEQELEKLAMVKYPFVDVLPRELGFNENDLAEHKQRAFKAGYEYFSNKFKQSKPNN